MPFYSEISNELTTQIFVGKVTYNDCVAAIQARGSKATRLMLWDFTAAAQLQLAAGDIRELVREVGTMKRPPGARTAFVAPTEEIFAVTTQAKAFAQVEGLQQAVAIFRRSDEALQWLCESPRDPAAG
jgi:hypothetical protein